MAKLFRSLARSSARRWIYISLLILGLVCYVYVEIERLDMGSETPAEVRHPAHRKKRVPRNETDANGQPLPKRSWWGGPEEPKPANPLDITIVTMYLRLGPVKRADGTVTEEKDYLEWMRTWGWLTNTVVAYFDDDEMLAAFKNIRKSQPADKTILVRVNRTDLSSFDDLEDVRKLFADPEYPKFEPQTVNAEWSCATNAKYDILQRVLDEGHVKTETLAWLDIGLFKPLLKETVHKKNAPFTLELPDKFNASKIGLSEVGPGDKISKLRPWEIIQKDLVWTAGGFVLGTKEKMQEFITSYKAAQDELLEHDMISADMHTISAIYTPQMVKRGPPEAKAYICRDGWFGIRGTVTKYGCLAFLCKEAAETRAKARMKAQGL
ncbi:protein HtrL [Elysia marginata]|uniref:Protein HtrL n=1 Tax=Elysia marginata TaxID=1093978 RepID=A0AAV4JJP0_9GAST|nr:protein HtrL [Elysia marginata]